ncbi:MAG: hypothetical protein AAB692_06155 [Patescibacteria group bacterium]
MISAHAVNGKSGKKNAKAAAAIATKAAPPLPLSANWRCMQIGLGGH